MVRAGGGDYVFFDHDAAYVVAAEAQAQLACLQALRYPGGLHVFEIVKIDAGNRQRLQVLHGGGFLLDEVAERSVFALEGPGDEGRETAGLLLQVANQFQVVHALLDGFAAAEHHGGGGAHAELMRGAMHVHPILGVALKAADAMAHGVIEDFGAAAGDGIEAGIHEALDGVAKTQAADIGDVGNFRSGQAVQVNAEALLDAAKEIFVPLDFKIGVKAALHQDAGAAEVEGLLNFFIDDFLRQHVPFGMAHGPVEGAEAAVLGAEVGVVDITIDDVGDDVLGVPLTADRIGLHANADQVVGTKQVERFLASDHTVTQPANSKITDAAQLQARRAISRLWASATRYRVNKGFGSPLPQRLTCHLARRNRTVG